ncbi:MAG: hypothetical protein GY751_10935, partial [Bacteroidetes bacterium]|nr:hypothetical protein [Bacteroidota bacterium]
TIGSDETSCNAFDPSAITELTAPVGGTGDPAIFLWEYNAGGGWQVISGATSVLYDPALISQTTQYRRAVKQFSCSGWQYSNVVTKEVVINPTNAGSISGDETNCDSYDPVQISSASSPSGGIDGTLVYQWQLSTDGGSVWIDISGATFATYDPGTIIQTTLYRRGTRRSPCASWIYSNTVVKAMKTQPTASIISHPVGNTCSQTEYTFDAASSAPGTVFTWDFGAYAPFQNVIGKGPHTLVFDIPKNDSLTQFTVKLHTELSECTQEDTFAVSAKPLPEITAILLTDPSNCGGNEGEISFTVDHPTGTIIQISIDGGVSWGTDNQVVFSNLSAGTYTPVIRYNDSDCPVTYAGVILGSPDAPVAEINFFTAEECGSESLSFVATESGASATYNWNFGTGASPAAASGVGPHSVTYLNGGNKTAFLTVTKNNCFNTDQVLFTAVINATDAGQIDGEETDCSTYDPASINSLSEASGGEFGTIEYQWEYRENNGTGGWTEWSEILGSDAANYDPPIINISTQYRRKVRRTPCNDWLYSNVVSKNSAPTPALTSDLFNSVCPGIEFSDNFIENDNGISNATFSIVSDPSNGSVTIDDFGDFTYTPFSAVCASDAFTYQVCNDNTSCCATATVTLDMNDTYVPQLLDVPEDITISCDEVIPSPPLVQALDNCPAISIELTEETTQATEGCELNNYILTRTWTATDYCGNSSQDTQLITITDNTSPDIYRVYTLPNGRRLIAGVMENVTSRWKTISFPITFSGSPIIFSQIVSEKDMSTAIIQHRNISSAQFEVKLSEEENSESVHGLESIAWIAIEAGQQNSGQLFETSTTLLDDNWKNLSYNQTYSGFPLIFASIQSSSEMDPGVIRFNNNSTTGVELSIQEETSKDVELIHSNEVAGYLAAGFYGDFLSADGEVMGELGSLSANTNWQTVNLSNNYHNPVVIANGLSFADSEPVSVIVRNSSSNSFEIKIKEWDYQDGVHSAENVHWMVIEGSIPLNKTVECSAVPESPVLGTDVIAVDNCDVSVVLEYSESPNNFDCSSNTTVTRTWSVSDECGNTTELVQTLTLTDNTPPAFTVPSDVTLLCSQDKDDLSLSGDVTDELDNCATGIEAAYSDDVSGLFECVGLIPRTWSLTDDCGNTTVHTQNINVFDDSDSDNDGKDNVFDLDDDNDGIPDNDETLADVDGDGIVNKDDLDSDGDGIYDIIESGGTDVDGNGMADNVGDPDWDIDEDGFAYGYDANGNDPSLEASDDFDLDFADFHKDNDGAPNFYDEDSDDDGLTDGIEDKDKNGIVNSSETDPHDPDTDDDLIIDGVEDENKDGYYTIDETDPLNPDTDGDSLQDGIEDSNQDGDVDVAESDPRDPCDPILSIACQGVVLDIKMFLQGALIEGNGEALMRDDLRQKGYLPTTEPYTNLIGYNHVGEGGNEIVAPEVFEVTGDNAITDWVFIELRPKNDSSEVIATQSALLQRDGNVVNVDGVSSVRFDSVQAGEYFVSVRHRNHLGVMTQSSYLFSETPVHLDFTAPSMQTFGDFSNVSIHGSKASWAGDLSGDGKVIYQGPNNDIFWIFLEILFDAGNLTQYQNYIVRGYKRTDFNMDGQVILQGPGNDRAKLLFNVILPTPTNTMGLSNFIVNEALPVNSTDSGGDDGN